MNDLIGAFRKASVLVLLLSVPALLAVATLVVGGFAETSKLLGAFPVQLSIGFVSMLLLSWLAAPFLAKTCVKSLVVSGFFGVGELFFGVLMASLSSALLTKDFSLHDYVLKPIFWVVPTGMVPAFALGIVGGAIARRAARSAGASRRRVRERAN